MDMNTYEKERRTCTILLLGKERVELLLSVKEKKRKGKRDERNR
jgi:hypothetical protein